jgi:hypothetical protein
LFEKKLGVATRGSTATMHFVDLKSTWANFGEKNDKLKEMSVTMPAHDSPVEEGDLVAAAGGNVASSARESGRPSSAQAVFATGQARQARQAAHAEDEERVHKHVRFAEPEPQRGGGDGRRTPAEKRDRRRRRRRPTRARLFNYTTGDETAFEMWVSFFAWLFFIMLLVYVAYTLNSINRSLASIKRIAAVLAGGGRPPHW